MAILKIIFFPITLVWWLIKLVANQFNKIFIGRFFKGVTISKIDALTGEEFEDVCALIFKYAGYTVQKTGGSGDYGADLVVSKRFKIVVQAKLYYKHGVGNHSVQEVTSALKYYKADFACVITNWKYTNNAKTIAQIQNVILINRDDIIQFLLDVKNKTKLSKIFNLTKHFKANVQQV